VRDPLQVLEAVREHAGLTQARPFTQRDFLGEVYTTQRKEPTEDEAAAVAVLQKLFATPQANLWQLLQMFNLDGHMQGVDNDLNLL
jgi:hypothetical protein